MFGWKKKEEPQIEEPKEQTITFEIVQTTIKRPKEDECVVFTFPENTPEDVMRQWDKLMVDFQNGHREFISTTLKVDMIKTKKGSLRIKRENDKSNTTEPNSGAQRKGSDEGSNPRSD